MALRLTAAGRQAALAGGVSDLFNGSGNNFNIVFKTTAQGGDVDSINAGTEIATLTVPDQGASNVNGSYAAPSDDATTASVALAAAATGNAVADHDYADGGDGVGNAEVFVGTGRTAGDKVADLTVGGPGTTGTQDLEWPSDDVTNGGLLTVTAFTFTKA